MDNSQIVPVLEASRDAFSSVFTRMNIKEAWKATTLLSEENCSIEDNCQPVTHSAVNRNSGDDLLCWGGYEVVRMCLFLTNRATQDSTLLGCLKPFLEEIAFSGILLCIFISRKHPQFRGFMIWAVVIHWVLLFYTVTPGKGGGYSWVSRGVLVC